MKCEIIIIFIRWTEEITYQTTMVFLGLQWMEVKLSGRIYANKIMVRNAIHAPRI